MYLDELKQLLNIESWKEIQLVFYIFGIYYGFITLRWLANKLDKRNEVTDPGSYEISEEQYEQMMRNAAHHARNRSSAPSNSKTNGKAIISELNRSGKYAWDGRYLNKFSGIKLFEFDGQYVSKFSGTKLYQWDGKVFSPFSGTGKYSVSGNVISVFSGSQLYSFDNQSISKFSGTRLYSISGDIELPIPLMIMIAEGLEGL
ncbi:MAG: hypothetical protein HRU20_20715 [Pseudomonadales bacterium]|nr:hypothetical protein [Pseudomonadales bacterium]